MASSAPDHRSGTPLGALADVPPHVREQEPYSVGPSPLLGVNVQAGLLPTHHGLDGPVRASAPGQVGGNRLTIVLKPTINGHHRVTMTLRGLKIDSVTCESVSGVCGKGGGGENVL
jgi:hypothetical protein